MKARIKGTLVNVEVINFTDVTNEFVIVEFQNGEQVTYPVVALDFVSIKSKLKILKSKSENFFFNFFSSRKVIVVTNSILALTLLIFYIYLLMPIFKK